jgi:hypothetical protein
VKIAIVTSTLIVWIAIAAVAMVLMVLHFIVTSIESPRPPPK